ncbi:MAG: protoporphyrinogen oxidase [Chloroflexota bacterium]|nr:protoporphyrinogen oxidase [Chloroflexota bacterium]
MKVAIIGGGIAGLATAFHLQQLGKGQIEYTLIDNASRFGGKIASVTENGFVVEGGPDSFMTQKVAGLELCRAVGLEKELMGTNQVARKVFVWSDGRLQPMPDGVTLIIPTKITPFLKSTLLTWPGKLRMGLDLFIPKRKNDDDESLAHFIRRRLGNEALDRIAAPMIAGIYVADAEALSLKSTFPRFLDMEKKYGSLLGGMLYQKYEAARAKWKARKSGGVSKTPPPGFMTLKSGLQGLPEAIVARLDPKALLPNRTVTSIQHNGSEYDLVLSDGTHLSVDALVFATPAYVTAQLLRRLDSTLAEKLQKIRYVSTATVSLGFKRSEVEHPLSGFGFVVSRSEKRKLMACAWSSTKFNNRTPDDKHVLIRAFVGGANAEGLAEQNETALVKMVRDEMQETLGITATPVITKVYRWHKANPQYDVGHDLRIAEIERLTAQHSGLYLAGAAYHGVGVPDCIADGKRVAQEIVAKMNTVPTKVRT